MPGAGPVPVGAPGPAREPARKPAATRRPRRAVDPDLVPAATAAAGHRGGYHRPAARLADGAAAAAAEVVALAAPVDCVCCGAEDLALCSGCERQVRLLMNKPFRAEAQAPALMDVNGSVLLPVVAAGAYRAELAQAVLSFKRHGQVSSPRCWRRAWPGRSGPRPGTPRGCCLCRYPPAAVPTAGGASAPVHVLLGRLERRRVPEPVDAPALAPSAPSGRRACGEPADKRDWGAETGPGGCGDPCGSAVVCLRRR